LPNLPYRVKGKILVKSNYLNDIAIDQRIWDRAHNITRQLLIEDVRLPENVLVTSYDISVYGTVAT